MWNNTRARNTGPRRHLGGMVTQHPDSEHGRKKQYIHKKVIREDVYFNETWEVKQIITHTRWGTVTIKQEVTEY